VLVLKRKEGEWIEITHSSGDLLRIRVYGITNGRANLAFDDNARNFKIERSERVARQKQQELVSE
jgi:sRNA-binding carbon storage regulator CsrA